MPFSKYAAYVKIPGRNLARHPWRTVITGFVTVLGLVAILAASSVRNGIDRQMTFSMTGSICGDIEVARAAGNVSGGGGTGGGGVLSLATASPARLRAIRGVVYAAPRISLTGVVASATANTLVSITGVDAAVEERLVANLAPASGASLRDLRPGQVAVSAVVAKRLGLSAGDQAFVAVGRPDGTMERRALDVATIFAARTDPGWLERTAFLATSRRPRWAGLPPARRRPSSSSSTTPPTWRRSSRRCSGSSQGPPGSRAPPGSRSRPGRRAGSRSCRCRRARWPPSRRSWPSSCF